MAPWTAVDVRVGFVSSSTTERLIFLPFDPALGVLQVHPRHTPLLGVAVLGCRRTCQGGDVGDVQRRHPTTMRVTRRRRACAAARVTTDAARNPFFIRCQQPQLQSFGRIASSTQVRTGRACSSRRVHGADRSGIPGERRPKRLVRHAWKQGSRWSGGHLTLQLRHEMRREDRSVEQICDDHDTDDGQDG